MDDITTNNESAELEGDIEIPGQQRPEDRPDQLSTLDEPVSETIVNSTSSASFLYVQVLSISINGIIFVL